MTEQKMKMDELTGRMVPDVPYIPIHMLVSGRYAYVCGSKAYCQAYAIWHRIKDYEIILG